jgi:ABC-type nickel/cobalt efflux system permease component RcnA
MKKRGIVALAAALLAIPRLDAHPMGNFSVNRYARLEPTASRLALTYIVDFAEIPTFQEISTLPALGAMTDPAALNAAADARRLTSRLARSWAAALSVRTEAGAMALHLASSSLGFSAGAAGLPTMKLTLRMDARWPNRRAATVFYEDANAPDRLGWREVVLRRDADAPTVSASDVGSEDRSAALTSYPVDPTAEIPDMVSARFHLSGLRPPEEVTPGHLPAPVAGDAARVTEDPLRTAAPVLVTSHRRDRFADLVATRRLTAGIVLLSLLVAFCLGGLHALSPGHGKTVVAAYLVGSRGTARHALLLGTVVTASHTVGVFLLGLVTLALSRAIVPEKLYPAIQFLSGLTIVGIGGTLFARRLARRAPEHHGHSHAVEVPESAPTASALLALGISGGILPCPSALVVLLSAIALHRIGFGLVLIVAFSMGLAAVLSGIGILVVRAGRLLSRFERAGDWARRIPAFSALLIGMLGVAIATRALPDLHRAFFTR